MTTNKKPLTEIPKGNIKGFLGFPLNLDLENLDAHIAIYLTIKALLLIL